MKEIILIILSLLAGIVTVIIYVAKYKEFEATAIKEALLNLGLVFVIGLSALNIFF